MNESCSDAVELEMNVLMTERLSRGQQTYSLYISRHKQPAPSLAIMPYQNPELDNASSVAVMTANAYWQRMNDPLSKR